MKKNITLVSLMLGIVFVFMVSGVSAAIYGSIGPDYAFNTGTSTVVTNEVYAQDSYYTWVEGEDEIQGEWNHGIPSNAIVTNVWFYVRGYETIRDIETNVQLWSAYTDESLTGYKALIYNIWTLLTFQSPSLTNEVQNRISAGQPIKLEADFEDPTCKDCGKAKIDYIKLKIEYTVPQPCQLIIDEPICEDEFDSEAVEIKWHLEGDCQSVVYFNLYYHKSVDGQCNTQGPWNPIITNLGSGSAGDPDFPKYHYSWNKPEYSGQYCIYVEVHSAGAKGYSCIFNVDLAPPYVNLSVGTPQNGDCAEDGTGDCYVNKQTPITLTCHDDNPNEPWQSGVNYIEYQINSGGIVRVNDDHTTFYFNEDSEHTVRYWCYDEVGKKSDEKTKDFIVDTQAPIISRIVGEPQCCRDDQCDLYVNTNTEICVSAYDPQPHPVDMGELWCEYHWGNNPSSLTNDYGPFVVEDGQCFKYQQDSYHRLDCWAIDRLGNRADISWEDIVDTQAPETTLTFEGPYHSETEKVCTWEKVKYKIWGKWFWKWVKTCETISSGVQWIDGVTTVVLEAEDPTPHPVEGITTYYRYGIVDNEYCLGTNSCPFEGLSGDWIVYENPFTMDESCHAIEYRSVDCLGNTEVIKKEFVFVDKTVPETVKEVGEPSAIVDYAPQMNWYENPEQNIEWEVTIDTPITISCGDIGPHPSGIEGMWYRIVWDGKYNDTSAQWQFVDEDYVVLYFQERSEHLLEFYCVDNVNKISEVDSELFKVKGTKFELEIGSKWDLVSVPFQLIGDGDVAKVFNNSNVLEVWSYENGGWKVYSENVKTLTHIVPGRGYWIRSAGETSVLIGGELYLSGGGVIPIEGIDLEEGWNLIGHYGTAEKTSYCSLFRLVDGSGPLWRNLLGYNPDQYVQSLFEIDLDENTEPGRGYWIDMTKEATYRPSSICFGESNYY